MTTIKRKEILIHINKYIYWTKKILFLVIAIVLMGFAQGLLSYTSRIGMAPIDSAIRSVGLVVGIEYNISNYIFVFFLVTVAIIFSKPKDRLLTATAYVTGYCLAFLVTVFIDGILVDFPGLSYEEDNGPAIIEGAWGVWTAWGVLWFLTGWFSLVVSIGIWLNVGFGLRPYDVMIIKIAEKFPKHGYVFYRNMLDLSWVFISLAATSLSLLTAPNFDLGGEPLTWISRSSVGAGTILFVIATGFATNLTRKIFSKIV